MTCAYYCASEVLRLNEKGEYCLDHNSVHVTLKWPLAEARSDMVPAAESCLPVDGQATDSSLMRCRATLPNTEVEYARRIIHILTGIAIVLVAIGVIMFLNAH